MNCRNSRGFPKKINEPILRQWQQTYLEKLLCLLQYFFSTKTNRGKMETTSRKTQCPVSKILKRYIKELKLTALLVLTKWTFSTWRICFHFLGNPLLCAIVWWVNKNFLSWRPSNDCQIARPALVSGPPNWKKPYNKHLISLVFSVRTVN